MPLLDRQVKLLEYLMSGGAIFGVEEEVPLDQALLGIDRRLLRLEARFTYGKRLKNIIAVFPNTFRLLAAYQGAVVREFVETCPPANVSRNEVAAQFYNFLRARWRRQPPEPPLEDLAACEFACARVRVGINAQDVELANGNQVGRKVRRRPDLILLRCAFNIRPIFEDDAEEVLQAKRDTPLAITIPPGAKHPKIFELLPPIFDLLESLSDWTDRFELGAASEVDELICELSERGLVEVRG
jgi:hypothetical protein